MLDLGGGDPQPDLVVVAGGVRFLLAPTKVELDLRGGCRGLPPLAVLGKQQILVQGVSFLVHLSLLMLRGLWLLPGLCACPLDPRRPPARENISVRHSL